MATYPGSVERLFLDCSVSRLRQYAGRIDECLGRLSEEQIWERGSENQNAAGNLVLHLCGNVRQWIISGLGGQEDVRDRDAEFAARVTCSRFQLASLLQDVVEQACVIIGNLPGERLTRPFSMQGYQVTVLEAVYHVVEHFSHHAGQILFTTKLMTGADLGFYRHLRGHSPHGRQTP